jgi:broad specificity phosphatase PhoE
MPKLYFIRHGETDWNAEGRLQGQTERPLNARGLAQAEQAGRALGKLLKGALDLPFVASPMIRTRQTMQGVRKALGLPPDDYATDPRLIEVSFGRWEGLVWPEVQSRDPAGAAAREEAKWSFVPPGGESYAILSDRVMAWHAEVTADQVVVSHGGVARALMHRIAGIDPTRAAIADIRQGSVLLFDEAGYRWIG